MYLEGKQVLFHTERTHQIVNNNSLEGLHVVDVSIVSV